MKLKNVILIISLMLTALSVQAENQTKKDKKLFTLDGKGVVATRVLNLPGSDTTKVEDHYTLKLALDVKDGLFKVVGIARSGDGYIDQWDTFAGGDVNYDPAFNVRSLYIEKEGRVKAFDGFIENYKFQVGSIPTDDGILRAGGLWGAGWLDGARLKVENDDTFGAIQITGASMNPSDDPSVFNRVDNLNYNYLEIKVSKKLFEFLLIEAAYMRYDDENYAKLGLNYDWKFQTNKVVKLIFEYIGRGGNGGYKTVVGAETDVIQLFTGKKSGIKLRVSWQYVSDNYDPAFLPATSFWVKDDNTMMIEASGPLVRKWNLSWYLQGRVNFSESWDYDKKDTYVIVGIKKSIDFNGYIEDFFDLFN